MDARTLVRELDRRGVLLLTDRRLPSVVQCVTGKPAAGSWWSHPRGKEIFAASEALAAHRDVAVVKLVLGKVTFVHRRLWPALWSVVTAREPWQTIGLSKTAALLLERVDEDEELSHAEKRAVDELELRLLVHVAQEHTERGHHERVLRSWARWATEAKFRPVRRSASRARADFEALLPDERVWPWQRG